MLRRVDDLLARIAVRRRAAGYACRDAGQRLTAAFALLAVPFAVALEWSRRTVYIGRGLVSQQLRRVHVPYTDRIPVMSPKARRISVWVGAFAVLTAVEIVLALPLITGVSREAARSVQAAAQVVANQTAGDDRRAAPALEDKSASREGLGASPPAPKGSGNRGTPALVGTDEDETQAEAEVDEYSAPEASSHTGSASPSREGADTENVSSKAGASGSRGDTPRSAPKRDTPGTLVAPRPPSPPPPTPPVVDPPPPPPPSTVAVTRTAIRSSPPPPPPSPPETKGKKPPPSPPPAPPRSTTTTTTTTSTTTTSTTTKSTTSTSTTTSTTTSTPTSTSTTTTTAAPPTTTTPCRRRCDDDDD